MSVGELDLRVYDYPVRQRSTVMAIVEVADAAAELELLLERVAKGEEIILARAGVPAARLVAAKPVQPSQPRRLGGLKGKFELPDNFDDPLPDDILNAFEGR